MKKNCLLIIVIHALATIAYAQANMNTAPVKWEEFKNSDEQITIKFPKLPVKIDSGDWCSQLDSIIYFAYAEDAVYELKIYEKSDEKIPSFCRERIKFSEKSFSNHILILQTRDDFKAEKFMKIGEKSFLKFEKVLDSFKISKWLLNDFQNKRWFELTISAYKEKDIDDNEFVESLKLFAESSAIELKNGSPVLLGDDLTGKAPLAKVIEKKEGGHSTPLIITNKVKPTYTKAARENNTVGSVRVRVTFLPNGAIGSVTPTTELENGLTGQAVEAARKIAFLPQRHKDRKVAVTKVVVFTFTIY